MTRPVRAGAIALAVVWVAAVQGAARREGTTPETTCQAPARLSETGLFAAGHPGVIDARNRKYSPQYPLWSDGAQKTRWVFLPPGSTIDASDAAEWTFPVGTRFWKEFAFNGRKIETRFLWRASAERWVFATYVWNEEGRDAVLAPDAGVPGVVELAEGRRHDVPGVADCRACHGSKRPGPLGFNALQLSTDRDPNAIHGEPLAAGMITLATLADERRLAPARPELVSHPPRIATKSPTTRAVLGYFAANCGACHNRGGEIGPSGPSLQHGDLLGDGDAVAAALTRHATAWQVPGQPDGASLMIDPASPLASAMLVRMRSRRPSSQMPPLGTVLRDETAIDVITKWIATELPRR
jgi:mono/diheme cytochrome c family protein